MACKVTTGIENSCDDVFRVGGIDKTFWAGYLQDLDTLFSLLLAADINTMDFGSYGGLIRFDGRKFAHQYKSQLVVGQGGTKSYTHTFVAKLISKTTANDSTLKTLAQGDDIFIVCRDNNQGFIILGGGNGLTVSGQEFDSGSTGESDTSTAITLIGNELTPPLRFALQAGFQATLDYLESREL